jgi:hypothetical protein
MCNSVTGARLDDTGYLIRNSKQQCTPRTPGPLFRNELRTSSTLCYHAYTDFITITASLKRAPPLEALQKQEAPRRSFGVIRYTRTSRSITFNAVQYNEKISDAYLQHICIKRTVRYQYFGWTINTIQICTLILLYFPIFSLCNYAVIS